MSVTWGALVVDDAVMPLQLLGHGLAIVVRRELDEVELDDDLEGESSSSLGWGHATVYHHRVTYQCESSYLGDVEGVVRLCP